MKRTQKGKDLTGAYLTEFFDFRDADDRQNKISESGELTVGWHVSHQCERMQHQTPCSQGGVGVPRQHG